MKKILLTVSFFSIFSISHAHNIDNKNKSLPELKKEISETYNNILQFDKKNYQIRTENSQLEEKIKKLEQKINSSLRNVKYFSIGTVMAFGIINAMTNVFSR